MSYTYFIAASHSVFEILMSGVQTLDISDSIQENSDKIKTGYAEVHTPFTLLNTNYGS